MLFILSFSAIIAQNPSLMFPQVNVVLLNTVYIRATPVVQLLVFLVYQCFSLITVAHLSVFLIYHNNIFIYQCFLFECYFTVFISDT
jgi:hypothetical protein